MFCHSCGNQVSDNASFCTKCGAQLDAPTNLAAQPQSANGQPIQQVPLQPQASGNGKRIVPIVALVVVAVVAVAVAAAVLTGGFGMAGKSSGIEEASSASESASSSLESDPSTADESEPADELDSGLGASTSKPLKGKELSERAKEIAMAALTNAKSTGSGMRWTGSSVSDYISPDKIGIDDDHLNRLASHDYMVIAKSCKLLENDTEGGRFCVEVVYEKSLDANGKNVQANTAEVGLWLDGNGLAITLTVR